MPRALIVEILGSAKEFGAELDRAAGKTRQFSKAAGVAGLAIAGGLAFGLEKSVEAAEKMQATQSRMVTAFRASGVSASAYAGRIEEVETASRKLGFSNIDVRDALGTLVVATHNGAKAIQLLSTAEDVARFKHQDLGVASKMLTMAMAGNSRAAKQLGIIVPVVSDHVQRLKDEHVKATTSAGMLEYAHAKLQDKLEQGQKVIQLVNDKLHGQSQAFADTASGGAAQFHAQMENLEEGLGKGLLPAITNVMGKLAELAQYFSEHQDLTKKLIEGIAILAGILITFGAAAKIAAAAQAILNIVMLENPVGAIVLGIMALAAAFIYAYTHSETFRKVVQETWAAVLNAVHVAIPAIRAAIEDLVNWAEAFWRKWGDTITQVARIAWAAVEREVKDAWAVISGVFNLIGDLIHGRWSQAWGDLKQIVTHEFDMVLTYLETIVKEIGTLGLAIGKELINGIKNGIESMASSLYDKAKNLVSSVKDKLEFWHSPPFDYGAWIGSQIVDGIASGLTKAKDNAATAGKNTVEHIKLAMTGAFNGLDGMAATVLNDQLRKAINYAKPQVVDYLGKMLKETTKEAVAGWNMATDAANALNLAQQQQQIQDTLQQYTDQFVDTQFAGAGYNVGMSPAEVYNLTNTDAQKLAAALSTPITSPTSLSDAMKSVRIAGMAAGGVGRVSDPTLFYSAGNEDYAFSGEGKAFRGGDGGGNLHVHFDGNVYGMDDFESKLVQVLARYGARNGVTISHALGAP